MAGASATFTWTAESGSHSDQLWIGSRPNSHDIDYAGTSGLTASFSNLPTNGQTLYVTLYGFSGGVWSVQDTATYTAATVALAQITSPPKDTTLDGDTETFTWSAESGATSYQLWIGSAPGLNDRGRRRNVGHDHHPDQPAHRWQPGLRDAGVWLQRLHVGGTGHGNLHGSRRLTATSEHEEEGERGRTATQTLTNQRCN